jgi:uncharacterized C2H2 Zn-finger protein
VSDDVLSFEDYRRRRDENASLVRCARCGKRILATLTRCPECGVHFQGEAQDYLHPSERAGSRPRHWLVAVAVLLLIAFAVSALGLR